MIITIDGPAGAGKSSAAKELAQRLGFEFLDTGAMYRAVALAALRAGLELRNESALTVLVRSLRLEMPPGGRVLLDGEDVTPFIRTREVTVATGAVADSPSVRRCLAQMQRAIVCGRNMVCEGRDQGTIVFPDAACKFFLNADPVEQAHRRQREMEARDETVELEQLLRDQEVRDRRDAMRDLAPMKPADDAVLLDSTRLGPEQVVEAMEAEVAVARRAVGEVTVSMRDWLSWFLYEMCYWISMPFFTLAFALRWEGGRNVPRSGPALLICNHQSYLDPLLVGVAARRRHLCFLARKTLFRGRFGGLIRLLHAVPVDQDGIAKDGLRTILEQLKAGRAVLVFPEGERTGTGELQLLKPGILLLLKRIAAPIVPVGIAGAFDALPRSRKWPTLSPFFLPTTGADITVSIGKPIPAERLADMPREYVMKELTQELKRVTQRAELLRRKC